MKHLCYNDYMGRKTFLSGAAILGAAGLLVQMMGAVFRIPLANIIGEVGMGYFQTAYPVYIFLLVFSTNGAPAAISKMTSERIAEGRHAEARRVFRLAFVILFIFGLVAFGGVALLARPLSVFVGSEGSYDSLLAISPALLFVPLMSVFRGYFQGMQEMRPTAVSQLAEQAIRVATGLSLAVVLLPKGLEAASAGACAGASIGPVAGLLILAVIYLRLDRRRDGGHASGGQTPFAAAPPRAKRESAGSLIKTLIVLTVPTTIGISILPIMNVADMLICRLRLLDAGFSAQEAEGLYGLMAGFAAPIINIPMALALSIALSMVPAVAAAGMRDREFLHKNVSMGLRTAMIIGVPCSLGLIVLAKPIMRLIYPAQADSAAGAAGCLAILGGGVIFLCVAQAMAGILQGLGKPSRPVLALLAGVAVKAVLTWILTGIPEIHVNGAAFGSTAGYAVIGVMNLIFVKRFTGIRFDRALSLIKPLLSGVVMGAVVLAAYRACGLAGIGGAAALPAICAGAVAYGLMILRTKAILPDEIALLPGGRRLLRLFGKH
ncbi:MAG: polysaccharide biosynthesis protein [Clostridiales Family XIII bacterium]|jgi:stage V sporulation protein B|nr:polysaccharide biosynthesis protein [Clostridiales Family XIII bacterium]